MGRSHAFKWIFYLYTWSLGLDTPKYLSLELDMLFYAGVKACHYPLSLFLPLTDLLTTARFNLNFKKIPTPVSTLKDCGSQAKRQPVTASVLCSIFVHVRGLQTNHTHAKAVILRNCKHFFHCFHLYGIAVCTSTGEIIYFFEHYSM